ncbi:MAG TPA: hypothetical protein VNJ51_12205 [Candidatus Dormibacteraeota bacterium]|nr:hypothetical protein [Candidatus Dormibacteraeota bacterium]
MAERASGRPTASRRRFGGALVASCCLHAAAIALAFSLLRGLLPGVPLPSAVRSRLASSPDRSAEMVFTSVEFRPKPAPPRRRASPAVAARPAPVPLPARRVAVHRRLTVTAAPPEPAVPSPSREPPASVPGPAARAEPPASAPSPPPTPEPTPTPLPQVVEAGLWGLDSAPVLLEPPDAILGRVHRRLRIEVEVDAAGRATRVRVEDAGDAALSARVRDALLAARYAAARCNNLPCSGELVLVYP